MSNFFDYNGWELKYFDDADNFRSYQIEMLKKELNGSIAEIGPGNGSLCAQYKELSRKVVLFEPSKNLFQNLNDKFKEDPKIEIRNTEFNLSEEKFDCILLMDVIEHIENPKILIKSAFNSLNDNGKIIINVPAFQHLYSEFDKDVGHYKRYNKKTFLNELNLIQPKKLKMFYYDSFGYLLSLISQLFFFISKHYRNNYKNNFKSKISLWNNLMPLSKILDKCIFNLVGKSLFIIIEK
tara:strand:+ start:2651 stop:3364 length:714 start_codon:yes stop_codon:yes gene_type:complete